MTSFRTFFHGRMTGAEITCLQSFLDHGHDLRVYAYDRDGIPTHFQTADAAEIVPPSALFHHDGGSLAPFSDLFRYRLLQRDPGCWWVDIDVACLRDDWPALSGPITAGWQDESVVCGAVLAATGETAAALERGAVVLGQNAAWGQSGPGLLTLLIKEKQFERHLLGKDCFYPWHYSEWFKPYLRHYTAELHKAAEPSYAVHLWNEMGKRHGFDKDLLPDRESYFGELVERHGTHRFFRSV